MAIIGKTLLGAALFTQAVLASRNGLGMTPQMGWNNWNALGCDVSEDLLLDTSKLLVDMGFRDAGYEYVVMDDCWQAPERNEQGQLYPNATRFPNGMKHVSDNVHALGMKFGMYSTAGRWTCAKYPASLGHEQVDAQTFADYGVDYLKYDNCFNEGQSGTPQITFNRYNAMSEALNATGRPIFYSLCNWGEDYPWKWAQTIANSWRMSGDITDSFSRPDPRCPCTGDEGYDCALPGFHCSAMNILNKQTSYPDKGFPGNWNDLDALEVGNGGMTDTEYVTHFTMWSLVKSAMLMGNDIRSLNAEGYSILTNPAVLAVSQDPLGIGAVRRWRFFVPDTDQYGQGDISMYSGQLSGGDYVVALLNTGSQQRLMNATLADVFVDEGGPMSDQAGQAWDLYDLWGNRMPTSMAQAVRDKNSTDGVQDLDRYWYNATATSFADGLANNNTLLMGTKTGSVQPSGTIEATVDAHGVKAFRLRPAAPQMQRRSEL